MAIFNFLFSLMLVMSISSLPLQRDNSEYGDYFEGDMILDSNQLMTILMPHKSRNGLINDKYMWPNNTVYFDIKRSDFSQEQYNYILYGLREIEASTCIRFHPKNNDTNDYVFVTGTESGCYSSVGRQGGEQILNLQLNDIEKGCFRLATICHEFIHALGFYHQQSAADRDLYVKIVEENIETDKFHNFIKYNETVITDFGIPYDYGSVMHYGAFAFSKNGEQTIVPLDENVEIGQRVKMSEKDIQKLNLMYNCHEYL